MQPGYVLVRSDDLHPGPELAEYLHRVDATLEAHDATILVQAFPEEVTAGTWTGFITLLQFPSIERAKQWYDSPEYQAIRHLRTNSSTPTEVFVTGVAPGHRSADLLTALGR